MFENLRKIRKEKDIKVKEICEILNLETEAAYYKKETGKVPITVEEGKKIAVLFKESLDTLFFENELS